MNEPTVSGLISKFSLLSPNKEYDELAVDLNDIYESSEKLELLIKNLCNSSLDKETLIDQLIEIELELDHINWHYKSFKKKLKSLTP
ncbi:hypothetical protein Q9R38_25350 [Priestia aryabhattai]|uniref:hypothetical protein n=1 Tax=Priestia aryabhattai TaxID=412384 RepID=UPI0028827E05|nr:hypothetical protein [Priestia aryabhattai]MDT0149869.1 hypothetical protein [Priestia aryabhattai]MDT0155422.1 hypothetical protein [Priestia aryabhattai]